MAQKEASIAAAVVTDDQWRPLLAARMAKRAPAIADHLVLVLGSGLRAQGRTDLDAHHLRASIDDNIAVLLHSIETPGDVSTAAPPIRAMTLVRRFAQHAIPLYEVIDAYHTAEKQWLQACMHEIAALGLSQPDTLSVMTDVWDQEHAYIERVCRLFAWEHEAERSRLEHLTDARRIQEVTSLLARSPHDLATTESVLGYPLRNRHLALIVWTPTTTPPITATDPADTTPGSTRHLDHATTLVAQSVNAFGPPLVISRDDTTRWVWLPVPPEPTDLDELAAELLHQCPTVTVAMGDPAAGPIGFHQSHRQALVAHEIGMLTPPDRTLIPYHQIATLAFLAADIPRTRQWVRELLGPLAADGPREHGLRETASLYLQHNRSLAKVAAGLQCHKNTVLYRIGVVEQELGYPLADRPHDLALCLFACQWLGTHILTHPNEHHTDLQATTRARK